MRKSVIITGSSRGIGRATALLFAKKGYNVLINYNSNEEKAKEVKKEINEKYPNVLAEIYRCDVSNFLECKNMANFALSRFGKIDVLVANAGISQFKLINDTTEEDFNRIIGVNLKGVYNAIMGVLPNMLSNKNGSIVAVSSIWGVSGGSCEALYSASKAGVIGLCKALSRELGLSNIRVNCVAPGAIETEMNNNLSVEDKKAFAEETSLGRFGTPEEVAKSILFLAENEYVTGQNLVVDGGFLNC